MWFGQWGGDTAGDWWGDAASPTPVVTTGGGGFHKPYKPGERRKRGLDFDKRPLDWERELKRAYAALTGELFEVLPPAKAEAVRDAVGDHSAPSDAALPPVAAIDFAALAADIEAARAVIAAWEWAENEREEEEAVTLLLMQ